MPPGFALACLGSRTPRNDMRPAIYPIAGSHGSGGVIREYRRGLDLH